MDVQLQLLRTNKSSSLLSSSSCCCNNRITTRITRRRRNETLNFMLPPTPRFNIVSETRIKTTTRRNPNFLLRVYASSSDANPTPPEDEDEQQNSFNRLFSYFGDSLKKETGFDLNAGLSAFRQSLSNAITQFITWNHFAKWK
ncbi:hypothetical protein Tco_1518678, partial [Tanacetum coccineum]